MKNIQFTARFKIHDGNLEKFKKIAFECITAVKENEKDALQYDWYFSADQKEYVVRESYTDSNAVLAHMGNIGELLGQLLEISDFDLEVYGNMSEELKTAAAGLNPKVYSYYQGL